jgi:hypothetical protein
VCIKAPLASPHHSISMIAASIQEGGIIVCYAMMARQSHLSPSDLGTDHEWVFEWVLISAVDAPACHPSQRTGTSTAPYKVKSYSITVYAVL